MGRVGLNRRVAAALLVLTGSALVATAALLAFGVAAALCVAGVVLVLIGLAGIDVDPTGRG